MPESGAGRWRLSITMVFSPRRRTRPLNRPQGHAGHPDDSTRRDVWIRPMGRGRRCSPRNGLELRVNNSNRSAQKIAQISAHVSSWRILRHADALRSEGFEVKLLVDSSGPVRASDVFDAISELVGRGTLDQLVIYFSGHGFLNAFSEVWMLSNAPQNPNEAISLAECIILARSLLFQALFSSRMLAAPDRTASKLAE